MSNSYSKAENWIKIHETISSIEAIKDFFPECCYRTNCFVNVSIKMSNYSSFPALWFKSAGNIAAGRTWFGTDTNNNNAANNAANNATYNATNNATNNAAANNAAANNATNNAANNAANDNDNDNKNNTFHYLHEEQRGKQGKLLAVLILPWDSDSDSELELSPAVLAYIVHYSTLHSLVNSTEYTVHGTVHSTRCAPGQNVWVKLFLNKIIWNYLLLCQNNLVQRNCRRNFKCLFIYWVAYAIGNGALKIVVSL